MQITLLSGHTVLFDAEDWPLVSSFQWRLMRCRTNECKYAQASFGKGKTVLMHRLIMDAPPGSILDHIDGNGMNNTRKNLRFCTHSENQRNRTRRSTTIKRPAQGVELRENGTYRVRITFNRRKISLGHHASLAAAKEVYAAAAKLYFGEFAPKHLEVNNT